MFDIMHNDYLQNGFPHAIEDSKIAIWPVVDEWNEQHRAEPEKKISKKYPIGYEIVLFKKFFIIYNRILTEENIDINCKYERFLDQLELIRIKDEKRFRKQQNNDFFDVRGPILYCKACNSDFVKRNKMRHIKSSSHQKWIKLNGPKYFPNFETSELYPNGFVRR